MLGSHLSVAGGYVNAIIEGQRLGMDTVQIFTKNQRQWAAKPMDAEASNAWLNELHRLGWVRTVAHASYLVNLASPDEELFRKSIASMIDEVHRCEALEVPYVVVHPGSHVGSGIEAGLKRIIDGLNQIVASTGGMKTTICLETTVGGGNQLGGKFEELRAMLGGVRVPERVGTCLDTCHVTAAGYDISSEEKAAEVFELFDRLVGLSTLKCLHLNDSMAPLGSHRDRHEHIGRGHVGIGGFAFLMNDPRMTDKPMILETEKEQDQSGEDWDAINLRVLRSLIRRTGAARAAPLPALFEPAAVVGKPGRNQNSGPSAELTGKPNSSSRRSSSKSVQPIKPNRRNPSSSAAKPKRAPNGPSRRRGKPG